MKLKTITLLLALILCGSSTVLAQNNGNSKNKDKNNSSVNTNANANGKNNPNANANPNSLVNANTFAEMHLQKLEQDVKLTEDQRKELLKEYKKLFNNRQAANSKSDMREEIMAKQESMKIFEAFRDSILTGEQSLQFRQKQEERDKISREKAIKVVQERVQKNKNLKTK